MLKAKIMELVGKARDYHGSLSGKSAEMAGQVASIAAKGEGDSRGFIRRMADAASIAMLNIGAMLGSGMAARMALGAFAADEKKATGAENFMKGIISIIAKLILIPAALLAIIGIIQYASAHSDGDGPAQKKAGNMIAAGVMLLALSLILNGSQDLFTTLLDTGAVKP